MKVHQGNYGGPDWTLDTDVYFLTSWRKWASNPEIISIGGNLRYLDTLSYSIRL